MTPRKEPIRPVGGRRYKQDQNAPELKMHGETPQLHVGSSRQQHHNQQRHEKYPQDGQGVREVHRATIAGAAYAATRHHSAHYRLRSGKRQRWKVVAVTPPGLYFGVTTQRALPADSRILFRNTHAAKLCKSLMALSTGKAPGQSPRNTTRRYKPLIINNLQGLTQ